VKPAEKRKRFEALADLGCIACSLEGYENTPAEIHHLRSGVGLSQRAPDERTIPLCPTHHRYGGRYPGIHSDPKDFINRYGTEDELLCRVNSCIEYC
jgi:hypothetical protein